MTEQYELWLTLAKSYVATAARDGDSRGDHHLRAAMSMLSDAQEEIAMASAAAVKLPNHRSNNLINAAKLLLCDVMDKQAALYRDGVLSEG